MCVIVMCRVVESMVTEGLIEEDDKPVVMRSLLLRHRHVHDDRFRFSISARKHSSYTSLQVPAQPTAALIATRLFTLFPSRNYRTYLILFLNNNT